MPDLRPEDNIEEEKPDITKTPEYRKFKALLRKVIKAPPLRRKKTGEENDNAYGRAQ